MAAVRVSLARPDRDQGTASRTITTSAGWVVCSSRNFASRGHGLIPTIVPEIAGVDRGRLLRAERFASPIIRWSRDAARGG